MRDKRDADLVELVRQRGASEAYGELVRRYQGHAYGLAYSLLNDWDQAEDMAQEAFVRAYINLNALEDPRRFAAWLRRIVFGTCMDWLRAFRPQLYRSMGGPESVDQIEAIPDLQAETPHERAESRELSQVILQAISELPPKYRIPLTMLHLDGLSYEKVADFLEIPLGTAKSLISRARKKLRPALEAYAAEVLPTVGEVFDEHKLGDAFVDSIINKLEGFRWMPAHATRMGSIGAGLAYLSRQGKLTEPVSPAWLYGGTGQAFLLCMHPIVCPSAAFVWPVADLKRLAANIGCRLEGFEGHRDDADFAQKQEAAWRHVRESIDRGIPCYALQVGRAEYGPIHGYDESGYLFTDLATDDGPVESGIKPWNELAVRPEPWLHVYSLEPCPPAAPAATVRDALAFALQYNGPEYLEGSGYATGPDAFAMWMEALETGTALNHGHRYNAAVWSECRSHAVAFLNEAKERLGGRGEAQIEVAIACYSAVAQKLKNLSDRHPHQGAMEGNLEDAESAVLVREAGEAEQDGLEALARVVDAL